MEAMPGVYGYATPPATGKRSANRGVPYSPFAERRQPSAPPYASAVLPGQFILEDNRVYWLTSVLNEGSSGATRSQLWPAPGVRFQSSPAPKNECYVLARAFPVRRLRSLMARGAAGSRIPRTVRFVIRGCSYTFVKSLWVYARFVSTHLSVSPVPGPGCIPRRKDTPFGSAEVSIDRRQAICLRWAFSGNHDGQWQQGKRILKVATAGTPEYCRRGARSAGRTLSKSLNSDWSAAKLPECVCPGVGDSQGDGRFPGPSAVKKSLTGPRTPRARFPGCPCPYRPGG